ncbi:MAG: hypothetical protein CMJ31_12075 [Phycisphaerae bacterium]|nr:hypothetical protein [Phycisphaerae bacterium]|tara:strand:- start:191 stop:466 length:276 start_codon:yes stop_codon:yes gene_type:complete
MVGILWGICAAVLPTIGQATPGASDQSTAASALYSPLDERLTSDLAIPYEDFRSASPLFAATGADRATLIPTPGTVMLLGAAGAFAFRRGR